jgi:hypothetical protein
VKKLTNFKNSSSSSAEHAQAPGAKNNAYQMKSQSKKFAASKNNNPYPESGVINGNAVAQRSQSYSTVPTGRTASTTSVDQGRQSFRSSVVDDRPVDGNMSGAATVNTENDAARSDAAPSHGASSGNGTMGTIGGGLSSTRGADSTFSSPAPSVRSLTTTLTTIHSAAAGSTTNGTPINGTHGSSGTTHGAQPVQFSHQFPSSPPTAIPGHLAPQGSGGHPATYNTATANNLLTDNASILTLASSSKRRRRRSMDTDASVRALAPSSLFGGSRESLPLSVLSANIDPGSTSASVNLAQARAGGGPAERASIYSATGVAPALPSERNSYYAGKQTVTGDGGSVKSGRVGHGHTDSINGSIGGVGSPLASPREATAGKLSRSNSAWEESGDAIDEVEATEGETPKAKQRLPH